MAPHWAVPGYIPSNNEQNEPTQGDISETSNEPTQAKRNEFEELYASANEELYLDCDYVTRLDFMAKFTYFKVKAWKNFDTKYSNFAKEPRNVRLGLAVDGFNPFGNLSQAYSMWPVILTTYNLPPWLCMKESSFMLTLLILGPKSPSKDIDVYLRPLIDDLKVLWALKGVETIDVATGQKFNMRAMVLWTINDFPARSSLSGWSGQMERSSTREYPSLIHTFFMTYIVGGVFVRDEDRALYEEMVRLRALGSNTESGVPYTDEEINAMARKGKQRGHLPGVGRVLPGRARDVLIPPPPPPPQCTHNSGDVEKLKKKNKYLTKQVNLMMKLFRSDDKFSQMLTQYESTPEFGSGSGGCGDDEIADDEDGGEDDSDMSLGKIPLKDKTLEVKSVEKRFPSDMSLGNILPPWHQFLDQKIRGAHFSLGIVAGERFAIELTPSTFPQRHFAGDMFPQRHVAGERVGMLLGKASNVVVFKTTSYLVV
ncbi:hypothetical protein Tco_1028965 [Tanacetum coccineum]|uniref:Transposase n=1 Tax=Tanacetum coccineum TaxID=301880 RepID=A0ABQ5G3N7_9ASTR